MAEKPRPKLACGALSLTLVPERGGSVARLDYACADGRTVPVLRGAEPGEGKAPDQACFPLVPYVNRIRGGAFSFRGRQVRIVPNLEGDPSPLHGTGWRAAWEVESATGKAARLTFRHDAAGWPWPFHAAQHFVLDADGLSLTLTCTNDAAEPMPCGLGLHPFFPCTPRTLLEADVGCAWTIDAQTLPVERVPAVGRYDLRRRQICGAGLDNGFGGWSGRARLTDPDWPFELSLSSPEAPFLHVYAPAEGSFVAVEPVTHANAALNANQEEWEALGLRVLAPGETMGLSIRVDLIQRQ